MSLESRNNKPNLTAVDQIVDIMISAKSDLEFEKAENEMSKKHLTNFINRYAPSSANSIVAKDFNDDYSDRERSLLRSEVDRHRSQYKKLMQQYDELYTYCEKLLIEAEDRRKNIEEQNEKLLTDNSKMSSAIQSHDILASHAQAQILKLTQERDSFAQELKAKTIELESISAQLNEVQEQEAWNKSQVQRLEAKLLSQQLGAQRALNWISETSQIIESLCTSIMEHFDRVSQNGSTDLSPKAGKILAEQLRSEIINLKKMEVILTEAKKPIATVQPSTLHPGPIRIRDA